MKTSIVKCKVETQYFKRGKTAVKAKVLSLLKTNSCLGSLDFVQEDMSNCMESFICSIDNFDETIDGYYDLIVRFYPGTYEYPDECDVEYTLRKA